MPAKGKTSKKMYLLPLASAWLLQKKRRAITQGNPHPPLTTADHGKGSSVQERHGDMVEKLWLWPGPEWPFTCRNRQQDAKGQPPQHAGLHPHQGAVNTLRTTCSRKKPGMMMLPPRTGPPCYPKVDHPWEHFIATPASDFQSHYSEVKSY